MRHAFSTFIATILCLLSFQAAADSSVVVIPRATDLSQDAVIADKKRIPILVLFSAEYCEYCKIVETEFLKPMIYSGDYKDKVIIRMLRIDEPETLRNFQGKEVTVDEFAQQENAFLTPTLKLYDSSGTETVPNMVGINTVDFYGGYLDDAIEKSIQIIRQRDPFKNLKELARK
jgi:thioredoxin-related protein